MTLPKPKAIIFDWDDTVVETWPVITAAFNIVLGKMGKGQWSDAEARDNIGPPAQVIFTRLFGEDRWKEADQLYLAAYREIIPQKLAVYPYMKDILDLLAEKDVLLTVVSAKRGDMLRQEAELVGLESYFNSIVGTGDAEKDKPDPAIVMKALEGSGVSPGEDVWFIGDSYTDMACALQSGCTPILIETKPPKDELLFKNPPAKRVATHESLLALLNSHFVC